MSRTQADLPDTREHRRQTARQVRHDARATLHHAVHEDWLEDADVRCPKEYHDLGRHDSPPPPRPPKEGRRGGFKVWKTPYWKRRKAIRRQRNEELRHLADQP
ncbi:MAG TPA: hypothetical protein VKV06_11670 [Acidimicrobiales bacterium]|nr:hypothetical protein [Acidimicrobiales bacterium]